MSEEYGLGVETDLPFEQAVFRTRIAMMAHGFGILSEMPAPAALGEPQTRKHLFMGVWQGLISADNLGGPGLDVGDHLACNFVVFEEGGQTFVVVLDPEKGMEGWTEANAAAERARTALEEVLEAIAAPE